MTEVALVQYGLLRHTAEFLPRGRELPRPGGSCVVETPRGVELGWAIALLEREQAPSRAGVLVRPAKLEDESRYEELAARTEEDRARAQAIVGEHARVVGSERLLDGERVVLYYTSPVRVPVPELLPQLNDALQARVRLVHLGARQRASLVGGCGTCGRSFCCSTVLRRLEPVPIRQARVQGLALDPDRSAGRCGRLKCCLRYENDLYEERRRGLPRTGWHVTTRRVSGVVLAVDVLRGKVLVKPEGKRARSVFAEEITNKRPPKREPLPVAGQPAAALPPPSDPETEAREDGAGEDAERPDASWSQMAWRLWRRWRDKDGKRPESAPGDASAGEDAAGQEPEPEPEGESGAEPSSP